MGTEWSAAEASGSQSSKESPMTAYVGYHQGLLQGAIFGSIALLVIVLGVLTYRSWVARSENRHILRGDEERRSEQGHGDPTSHGV
jgi:hypothetical protein